MIKRFFTIGFILCFSAWQSFSQEVVSPLSSNPVIKEYLKRNPPSLNSSSYKSSSDTIRLPFIDDFSKPVGIYPDPQLWQDSDAFINSTYCDNPVTVGVATLDGIDKKGNPYDYSTGSSIICDHLTSQPIKLDSLTGGDSVYFSFYYQPQGLGDEPESGDSLVLEFLGKDSIWYYIWSHDGSPDVPFAHVNIPISDTNYLYAGFQFRFYNYATPNGNRDHWNIDYIDIEKGAYNYKPPDIGFINLPTSLLKDYQSMPWPHYKNYPAFASLMKPSFADSVRNINYSATALDYFYTLHDENGNLIDSIAHPPATINTGSATSFTNTIARPFPTSLAPDSVSFFVKDYIKNIGGQYANNDTVRYTQRFYNYYAYDDGSAELSYGIPVANSEMAYRFDIKIPDTLKGVQIYFDPWGQNVHNELFSLVLWSDINVAANTETVVYNQIDNYVKNIDSINGFATYFFNPPQPVSGTIYVGIIQYNNVPLGVGLDANTDASGKMFYSQNNQWYQSSVQGSWMIRPFFGKNVFSGINEVGTDLNHFDIYPNPTSDKFTVYDLQFTANDKYSMKVCDALGRVVISSSFNLQNSNHSIDVSSLADGLYFVNLTDETNHNSEARKLIIQH